MILDDTDIIYGTFEGKEACILRYDYSILVKRMWESENKHLLSITISSENFTKFDDLNSFLNCDTELIPVVSTLLKCQETCGEGVQFHHDSEYSSPSNFLPPIMHQQLFSAI